jgi:serine/threonine-protein kinase RsbW
MSEHGSSTISLSFPAKPEYLIVCRLALNGLADVMPVSDEALSDLRLAVTEACANSISHGYGSDGGLVTMRIDVAGPDVRIEISDEGIGLSEPMPPPAESNGGLEEGGMGIALIRALVDDLEIAAGPGGHGTRVTFTKRLAPSPGR